MREVQENIQLTGSKDVERIATVAQDWMGRTAVIVNNILDGQKAQEATRRVTAAATLDAADCIIEVDATGGAITITLPILNNAGGVPNGKRFRIIKVDSSANAVTVSANTGQTINGGASVSLPTQYANAQITVPATGTNFLRWV